MIQYSLVHIKQGRLVGWEFRHLYDPLQLLRGALFLLVIAWWVLVLIRHGRASEEASPSVLGLAPP